SLVDLMRACQRDGLFRLERDRQGVMRLFPGNVMQPADAEADNRGNLAEPAAAAAAIGEWAQSEPAAESDVVDGDVVQEINAPPPVVDVEPSASIAADAPAEAHPLRASRGRGRRRATSPQAA